jgi:hypothetical protein
MKRAILIVGVCCTVLTLWLIPAEPLPYAAYFIPSSESELTPERQAANAIRDKAKEENALLKRLRLVDSLSARIVSSSEDPIVIDLPPEAGPEERSMLSEAIRRQVEYLGVGNADMVVGVSFVDTRFGNHPDFQHLARLGVDYYSGIANGRSFCLVVFPFYPSDPTDPRSQGNLRNAVRSRTDNTFAGDPQGPPIDVLGPCSVHLVHGSPGPAIRRWLRDDGMSRLVRSPWLGGDYRLPPISDHRSMYGEWNERRRERASVYGRESAVGEGCLAGRLDACRRAVLDPTAYVDPESYPELEEWISSGHSRNGKPFGGREGTWMGDLEAEFGRARFARFWTSDQNVEDAFAEAFGDPIGVWTMRWAQDRMGPQKAGPSTDLLSVLLTLVTLLACVGIATATATRRRV